MVVSLLSTKLYIPPVNAGFVNRQRLIEKLLSGVARSGTLTLLSGPAGFGKTALLSEFIQQYQQPVGWVSLDSADNDPIRFWTYFIKACQTVQVGLGEAVLALFRNPQPAPEDAVPTMLINEIAGQENKIVLVLDDYQVIQNQIIHSAIAFLLAHLPGHFHIIFSTRVDPPWPLARFRSQGQLIEIRANELRFTEEEAEAFLNRTMMLNLSSREVAILETRTEGWIAGLQLAALSMRGHSDINGFISAFTGSHVYVAEYLIEEVLQHQSAEIQVFLLQTSILYHLNGGLCEAVTGCSDGQAILTALQRANLFVLPLDDKSQWFRYHHLFADLLKARLRSSKSKTEIAVLHQRAARWYEKSGMIAEAVEHGLTAEDFAGVTRVLEVAVLPMILQAHIQTVERWLQAIPFVFIEKNPKINMAYAWMYLLRGMPLQAMPFIDRLKTFFSDTEKDVIDPSLQVEWLAIQSELLIGQGHPKESRDLAIQAQKLLSEVDPNIRVMIYTTLAKTYQQTLDYDRAAEVFQMIVQDARRIGDMTLEVLGISGEAQMVLKQGHLHRTYGIVKEGIQRLEMSGIKVPFSATLYGELGQVCFYWDQFDQAREYFHSSMETSGKSGYSDSQIYFHLMLSKICQIEGDLEGSVREMELASQLASLTPPAMIRENVIAQQVWINLAIHRPAEAVHLLEAEGFTFGKDFRFPKAVSDAHLRVNSGLLHNSALRVVLYQGKRDRNQALLKSGIDLAEGMVQMELQFQHLPVVIETLLLLSQMYALLDKPQKSLAAVARALELAEPEGFISPFIEEGQPIAGILAELLNNDQQGIVRSEYIRKILAAFHNHTFTPSKASNSPVINSQESRENLLIEPLSPRELEVLQLIANGNSNQTIAKKLFISLSAVKKHTGNIYSKLSVNSRTQAVSRARKLGLLALDS